MADDRDRWDGGHQRAGRGYDHRADHGHRPDPAPVPGRSTLAERLPPADPRAVANNTVRAALGAAGRIADITLLLG